MIICGRFAVESGGLVLDGGAAAFGGGAALSGWRDGPLGALTALAKRGKLAFGCVLRLRVLEELKSGWFVRISPGGDRGLC